MSPTRTSRDRLARGGPTSVPSGRLSGAPVPWRALLVRLFVVVPPAQVLGVLLIGQVLVVSGVLRDHPGAVNGFSVGAGVVAGLAVGVLVTPVRARTRTYVVASAAFGLVTYVVLTLLAQLRLPASVPGPAWYTVALGAVLVVTAQTLVAWALWVFRHRLR